jgi:hypothetical protein
VRPARQAVAAAVATLATTALGATPAVATLTATARGGTAALAATAADAAPAVAQGISVTPATPRPGQRIHISVPDCGVGPTPHTARSPAFTHDVVLYGKADTGEGEPRIRKDLRPGAYAITASCGRGHTVHGQVVVAAKIKKPGGAPVGSPTSAPSGSPLPSPAGTITATPAASQSEKGSNAPFWVIGGVMAVLLAGGTGLLLVRRRNG